MVAGSKSKLDALTRSLHRIAVMLFVAFLVAAVAGILWVSDEYGGHASFWRYVLAATEATGFLVAAVIAEVGSALVQTLARVRASLLDAILEERLTADELAREWPEAGSTL